MMDYEQIKALAKSTKQRATDLIALSPQNDPFYVGTPNDKLLAEWFADLWERFGYTRGVHLRRVHYQVVSQNDPPVSMPNGKPYENTDECWGFLCQASKMARYLGLVDPAAFEDHCAPDAIVNVPVRPDEPYIAVSVGIAAYSASLPDFPRLPTYVVPNYEGEQLYLVEVWAEKSTMNDVLEPLCKQYGVNLQTGLGEMSITACERVVAQRIVASGGLARILYVSDFDPAGQTMPVSVSRKIEYFIRQKFPDLDVRLIPVVLTAEQVRAYRLPRTPIKETERRRAGFEDRYGEGATELDALEALHPGALRRIMRKEILRYYDTSLARRVQDAKSHLHSELQTFEQTITDAHASEIAELQAEHEQLRADFEARMASHTERVTVLWEKIAGKMEADAPDIDDYPIPEAEEGDEHPDALYDSTRDYLEQIAAYKKFQGKGSGDGDEEGEAIA
jgi:hypothetical protein